MGFNGFAAGTANRDNLVGHETADPGGAVPGQVCVAIVMVPQMVFRALDSG